MTPMAEHFESHITLPVTADSPIDKWKEIATKLGWKTSAIDGDPLLGNKVFFYLTKHDTNFDILKFDTFACATLVEAETGVVAVRMKIEKIVFDTKTGVGVDGVMLNAVEATPEALAKLVQHASDIQAEIEKDRRHRKALTIDWAHRIRATFNPKAGRDEMYRAIEQSVAELNSEDALHMALGWERENPQYSLEEILKASRSL
jgi:hypothetical protein